MKKIAVSVLVLSFMVITSLKAQLPAASTDISPLLIGEKVPDAVLTNSKGTRVSIDELINERPKVIVFYNGLWCYFCGVYMTEQISTAADEIEELGYDLIAISPDMPDSLIGMSSKSGLAPEVFYQDGDGSFATAMGIAYQQPEGNLERLASYSGGLNKGFLPVPGVFVVNPDRLITFEYINPNGNNSDLRIKGDFLLSVLQALKQQ